MASTSEIQAGRAYVKLFLKNDFSRQLVRALKNAQAKLRQFGQSAMMTGRRIATVGVAMAAPFAFATRTFAQFDDAMREVGAVTQAVGKDFDLLTNKAKQLGASTSFTAIEVALLMAELGRAGFAPKQIDEMTGSVLSLARATKTEGTQAAGIMATAIRQFGLEASDASRVADVLTTAANKSFNTLETLGESLKFVGPIAADFNMSLEDTVAVLGTLGNVGIQGSMAGTTMRRILLATGAEAKKLQGIFGVSFVDAAGNARPLVDTLQDIADATRNLGSAERAKKFSDAFGLRGITGASAIGKNITGTRELRDAIAEAGGIAKKTADDMDAGLGGAFRILMSSIEGVKIEIGAALAPVLQKLSKFMTKSAQSAIKWIKANKGFVIAAAATAAGVIAIGVGLMAMGAAAQFAAFGLGAVAAIIAVVTSPLGILVAAIVGGTAAWFAFSESGKQALASLKAAFGGIKDALVAGDWGLAGKLVMAELKLAILKGLSAIVSAFPGTFKAIAGITGMALDGLVTMFGKAITLIKDQWTAWGKHVLDVVVSVAGAVVGTWQKAVEGMANWMLKTSAKGGIMGKAMSKILGVDMAEEQKKADRLDKALGLDKTDVLAEARNDVKRITEQWAAEAKAGLTQAADSADAFMQNLPEGFTSDIEGTLDRFVQSLESGEGVEAATKELAALRKVATDRKTEAEEATAKPPAEPKPEEVATIVGSASAALAAPAGVALTATYSAAAARISGFQTGGPEKQMVAGIDRIAENTAKQLAVTEREQARWKVQ